MCLQYFMLIKTWQNQAICKISSSDSGLRDSGKSTEAHLCVALVRIPAERAVHLGWVLREPCLLSRMQTSLNFAFWIKGSISFPLHFLRQDQSHIPG